jgi:hypothetical protein
MLADVEIDALNAWDEAENEASRSPARHSNESKRTPAETLAVEYLHEPLNAAEHWPRLAVALERRDALRALEAGLVGDGEFLIAESEIYRAELEVVELLLELELREPTRNGLEVSAALIDGQLAYCEQELAETLRGSQAAMRTVDAAESRRPVERALLAPISA